MNTRIYSFVKGRLINNRNVNEGRLINSGNIFGHLSKDSKQ